jgi:hypothetical protein
MVATPQTLIATTIGRVAIPKLADTLVKTGANKFVKQYGQKAFEAVLGTSIGARAYSKTEEYVTEYINHIDSGGDENSFVPKGSMPDKTRLEQMDAVMAVPNRTPFAGDLKVPGVIVPDATEIEKESQKIRDMTMPVGFPADPPIKVDTTTGDSEPPKIDTTEKFPIENKLSDTLSTPIPEPEGPQIFYNKDTKRGIGDNNPPSSIEEETTENITQDNFITKDNKSITNNLTTQNFLDDKLMDDLLVIRGGIEGYKKNMASDFPKMPDSTKAKMEIELQKKLFDKYKLNDYPEGETPDTVTEERKEYLINTYHKRVAAIEYITSVAYDVIGTKDKDSILVVDEDGLPLSAAKIAVPGSTKVNVSDIYHKDALVIVEMGSIFRNAGDQLVNDIIQKAKDENRRFVVAEDLTSEGALQAMKDRGFRTTTTKDTKKFKGKKIRRPNGRSAVQKNLVLDLSKEIIKEQTDNLLKNK